MTFPSPFPGQGGTTSFAETQAVFPFGSYHLDPHLLKASEWPGPALALAPLPPALKEARRQEFALRILREGSARVYGRLCQPPHAFFATGRRRVHLWESVEISVSDDGRDLAIRSIEARAATLPVLDASLTNPISDRLWVGSMDNLLCELVHLILPAVPLGVLPIPLSQWLRRSLQRTYAGQVDFRGLRRSVLAFLRPDPLTRSLANRIFGRPSADQFNWVGQHREELALLGVECPQWLPFLKYASRGRHLHPLWQLQRDLEQAGITPGGWATLPARGIAAMDDAVDFAWICDAHEVIAAYANLLEQMEASGRLHRLFTAAVVSVAAKGMADFDPAVLERSPTWFWRALWAETEKLAEDADGETLAAELARAEAWMHGENPRPDANQRRAGWAWIVRQSRDYVTLPDVARAAREKLLRRVGPAMEIWQYVVVPLTDRDTIIEEGDAMSNCLAGRPAMYLDFGRVLFSIREVPAGKRVACLSLQYSPSERRWEIEQLAGPGNGPVEATIDLVAQRLVRWGNGA